MQESQVTHEEHLFEGKRSHRTFFVISSRFQAEFGSVFISCERTKSCVVPIDRHKCGYGIPDRNAKEDA
jgi:hypothetical protein